MKAPRPPPLRLDDAARLGEEEPPDHEPPDELLTTFRRDGLSVGADYLRLDGATISRGELLPDRLRLHERIGAGAFSAVHRATWARTAAEDDNDEAGEGGTTTVAVKTFALDEPGHGAMLVAELRALVALQRSLEDGGDNNDNAAAHCLVRLHGAFLRHGRVAMVLEYMDRGSLADHLATAAAPPAPPAVAAVAYQVLQGLALLHDRRILHRDLKPANVLLSATGAVKLADFGLASDFGGASASGPRNRTVLGTSRYMAPERLRGRLYGRASDLWSCGLCLLECATLAPPWRDCRSLVDLLVTVEEAVAPRALVPAGAEPGLAELLTACLQQEPAKRIPAEILLESPWIQHVHNIRNREAAMAHFRESLSTNLSSQVNPATNQA